MAYKYSKDNQEKGHIHFNQRKKILQEINLFFIK